MNNSQAKESLTKLQSIIYEYFYVFGRSFPWREDITPYRVVVSEMMLQQTQTHRVAQKFNLFVAAFPSFEILANAPFDHVLSFWKGLGYNRRALNLQKIAQLIMSEYGGALPSEPSILQTFPGIGPATAASICAFAFNKSTVFIETNIRTVFIHFFFREQQQIHDREIIPLVEKTLDHDNPRLWYYALMDYGVMLKKTVGNLCLQSKHYTKQSRFEGSDRQVRGRILELLLAQGTWSHEKLVQELCIDKSRYRKILETLARDGFLKIEEHRVFLQN